MNILLVSPRTPDTFWSFRHVLPLISKKAAYPPLGLLTIAALLPREWPVRLVDLNVGRLDDATIAWADCVMISGMIVHADSARQVIARCLAAGKQVIGGGPLFTTGHEQFPELPHVVRGEAEALMPQLVEDLRAGRVARVYESPRFPELTTSPVPRWELLDLSHYATMPVQFSRGCPFNCEFCDVIVMNGRTPRSKTPAQLIAELDALMAAGWSGPVFVVDDNFIGHKPRAKELLGELINWRRRSAARVIFTAQASLNLAEDPELIDLMVQAGFKRVFVGIETPHTESLAECGKVQNTRRDLVQSVRTLHRGGLEVMGGFIVGFDSDTPGIFEAQRRFIQSAGVVAAMVGVLTALPGTRLFQRLKQEGRLLAQSTGNNVEAVLNFIPRLDRDELIEGYRRLVKHLYSPKNYYSRILAFLRDYRPAGPRLPLRRSELMAVVRSMWVLGVAWRGRREYWKFLARTLICHRNALVEALTLAITGHHYRRVAEVL